MSSDQTETIEDWRREAAKLPIEWTGDLDDDCTARWAGLTLRAEEMKRGVWWWAVTDDGTGDIIGSSNTEAVRVPNGKRARSAAESVAKLRLGTKLSNPTLQTAVVLAYARIHAAERQ